MNVNGLSFLQGGEMSYEELLQMEEQMGNVPKGLTEAEIARIPTGPYLNPQSREEMYYLANADAVYALTSCNREKKCL